MWHLCGADAPDGPRTLPQQRHEKRQAARRKRSSACLKGNVNPPVLHDHEQAPDALIDVLRAPPLVERLAPARPGRPKLVTVNAWNEWTEDSYLEPDAVFGFGYLDAVRRVFGGK